LIYSKEYYRDGNDGDMISVYETGEVEKRWSGLYD